MESFRIKCEHCKAQEPLYKNDLNSALICIDCAKELYSEHISSNYEFSAQKVDAYVKASLEECLSPYVCEECEEHHDIILLEDTVFCETCLQKEIGQFLVDDNNFQDDLNDHIRQNYGPFDRMNDDTLNEFEIQYYYKHYLNEVV